MWRRWPGHGTLPDIEVNKSEVAKYVVVPATDQLKRVEGMLTIRKEFYDNVYAALRWRVKMLLQRLMVVIATTFLFAEKRRE